MTDMLNKTEMRPVIGLMSGTSADGIDGCILLTDGQHVKHTDISLCQPYPGPVEKAIQAARRDPASFLADPHRRTALINAITDSHADSVYHLLRRAAEEGLPAVHLCGFHGQTVYHQPEAGRTIQLGDGNRLAQLCGLPVIYDFRRADMEAGGQGAPLAPVYHQILLSQAGCQHPAGFLNLGGIANLTACADTHLLGFDTGPANALTDAVCQTELGLPYDKDGTIAAQGYISAPFLEAALQDSYFQRSGPRSLDWSHFSDYLQHPDFRALSVEDKLASLTALSAQSIAVGISNLPFALKTLIVAGGGVQNKTMMKMISDALPDGLTLATAEDIGAASDMIEAELIAVLAARYLAQLPSTWPETTGASAAQIAGMRANPL